MEGLLWIVGTSSSKNPVHPVKMRRYEALVETRFVDPVDAAEFAPELEAFGPEVQQEADDRRFRETPDRALNEPSSPRR